MLNHTYTSVKNANLVDCGKKQHIPSQPTPLLKENFLGEFRTELDKKKVLAALGIATELSLEWGNIGGEVGDSDKLMTELDKRTKYTSTLDGMSKTIGEGIKHLESIVGGEEDVEKEQNRLITELDTNFKNLQTEVDKVKKQLTDEVDVDIAQLQKDLTAISKSVENITSLVQVSAQADNALSLLEGDNPGLYVPNLSGRVEQAESDIDAIQKDVQAVKDEYVKREEFGDGDLNFVSKSDYNTFSSSTSSRLGTLESEIKNTVKTGEDGHVDTLYVNKISKDNDSGNIQITDSFEVTSGIPLDVRFVVKTLDELHSLKPLVCYAGMGVIVSDLASLYILREPENGIIDEKYIKDEQGINWKCPEDLIIEVVTQEEYDARLEAGTINPHMFYYIHEEVVEEPLRKDFKTDEEYKTALDKWLRVLQQKYMSAVWGQEIESLVASKASNEALKSLESEIQRLATLISSLSGGSDGINLKDLNSQVNQNRTDLDTLIKEDGTIPTLQKEVSDLKTNVEETYVTKESITTEDPNVEYIFVKKSAFDEYKTTHEQAIAEKVTTQEVDTPTITLGDGTLNTNGENLLFNNEKIALDKQVPVIELIENSDFEKLETIESNKYYYVYDLEERYLLDSEFNEYKTSQNKTTTALNQSVSNNTLAIGLLENLTTENKNTLVYAINELHTYISQLSGDLDNLIKGGGVIATIQTSITDLAKEVSEKYVTFESITKEDPNVNYIFLKKSDFETYNTTHAAEVAKQITTETVTANSVVLGSHIVTANDSNLLFNNEAVAFVDQLPSIEVLDATAYKDKEKIDDDTYYMIFDTDERYIPDSEFIEYKTSQAQVVKNLSDGVTKNQTSIGDLVNLTTENKNTLVYAINELVTKINTLTAEVESLKKQLEGTEPIG